MGIAIFLDLFRRHHDDIHRLADTEHIPVYFSRHTATVIFAPFDEPANLHHYSVPSYHVLLSQKG